MADYRATLVSALPLDTPDQVIEELKRGLDVIVAAVRKEASGPTVTGDVRAVIHNTLSVDVGYGLTETDMDTLIEGLSRRGVVVLGKGTYDRATRIEAAGRKLERTVAAYHSCVVEFCERGKVAGDCPCGAACSEYLDAMCDAADAFVQVVDSDRLTAEPEGGNG